MRISYELDSLNLTFVYLSLLCVRDAPFFATFFALLLLIADNRNICMVSFDASSEFGLRFTIAITCLTSMSLNLSKILSFSILLC